MANFYGPIAQLEELGLFDVVLPFVLIFTIVFAFLQKTKILGEDSKKFNVVIAFVMGLGVVFPHVLGYYPPERDIVNIINQALPNVSIVLIAIVMALLIIGVLGRRFELGRGSASGWIALMAFGGIVYIFGNAAHWWDSPTWLYFLQDSETVTLIVAILIFAIIIWFITKSDSDEETQAKRLQALKDMGYDEDSLLPFHHQVGKMLRDPHPPTTPRPPGG